MAQNKLKLADVNSSTGTGSFVFDTAPSISGGTLTTSTVNGVTLTTGGGTTNFLRADGTYAAPSGGGTLDTAYDFGGSGAGRSITADSGAVLITSPVASNNIGLQIVQNDTTNNKAALYITTPINQSSTSEAYSLLLEGTNAGNLGSFLQTYHNSASPAVSDFIGGWDMYANNSAAAKKNYGYINVQTTNVTATTESARIVFAVMDAGIVAGNKVDITGTAISPSSNKKVSSGTTTLGWNGLYIGSGTTTVAPINLVAGTNLTTATAGTMEYDGSAFYATSVASSRQIVDTEQFISLTSSYTLTSQTAAQKLFNSTTNGALTVAASTTYFFECVFNLSSLSTSSGSFGFGFGGTATLTSQGWEAIATKSATLATATASASSWNTTANTSIAIATLSATGVAHVKGFVRINVAGTLIPQVSLTVAAAASVGINSFFRIWPVGSNTVTSVGNWS